MHPATILPEPLAHRPFRVSEGLELGLTPAALRSAAVWMPYRTVRVPATLPDTLAVRAAALALLLPSGGCVDGATAARLYGFPLPRRFDPAAPVEVRVPAGERAVRFPEVRCYADGPPPDQGSHLLRIASSRSELPWQVRVPVAHPAAVWARLVADGRVEDDELVAVTDALRQRFPGVDLREAAVCGTVNKRRAEQAITLSRPNVKSPKETELRLALHRAGVPEPALNRDVLDAAGGWVACPDLSWPTVRLAVEYDSLRHRRDDRQYLSDLSRNRLLEDLGWRVLIVTTEQLRPDPDSVVDWISATLRQRGLRW